jgi:hypothetical protein
VKSILKYRTDTIMTLNIPLELDVHDGLLPTLTDTCDAHRGITSAKKWFQPIKNRGW